ncbi:hypothetical protein ACRQ5Q_41235 (plasmid) [Bradyrhizobium sp. PMVTL-01]|uniref:hypothetical protein n=1 Tax=Bradyrhizobium sp. PMVTL-01 TaxID=3434999 RepID=UPI003F70DA90
MLLIMTDNQGYGVSGTFDQMIGHIMGFRISFSGKLDKVTVKVGPEQLTSDEHQVTPCEDVRSF